MTSGDTSARGLTILGSTLHHIRRVLSDEVDAATVTRVLHDAGFSAGESAFDDLTASTGGNLEALDQERFWSEFEHFLGTQGWGEFSHERIHPGLGVVRAEHGGESDPAAEASEPSCGFTSGMISQIFTRVAGSNIGVQEVSCRSRGDDECAFVFGSEPAVHRLRDLLPQVGTLDAALDSL